MGLDDLGRLQRVGAPQVSPDGGWVAYTVAHTGPDDKSVTQLG